jgi:hypothetical protein
MATLAAIAVALPRAAVAQSTALAAPRGSQRPPSLRFARPGEAAPPAAPAAPSALGQEIRRLSLTPVA